MDGILVRDGIDAHKKSFIHVSFVFGAQPVFILFLSGSYSYNSRSHPARAPGRDLCSSIPTHGGGVKAKEALPVA